MRLTCIYPGCKFLRYSRGLCPRHYATARNLVRGKRITWEQLQENGKALAISHKRSGDTQAWFLAPREDKCES